MAMERAQESILAKLDSQPEKLQLLLEALSKFDKTREGARIRLNETDQLLGLAQNILDTYLLHDKNQEIWDEMTQKNEHLAQRPPTTGETMVEAHALENMVPLLQNPTEQHQYKEMQNELNELLAKLSTDPGALNPAEVLKVSDTLANLLSSREKNKFHFSPEALLAVASLALNFIDAFVSLLAQLPKNELRKNTQAFLHIFIAQRTLKHTVEQLTGRGVNTLWTEAEPTTFPGVRTAFTGTDQPHTAVWSAVDSIERAKNRIARLVAVVGLLFTFSIVNSAKDEAGPTNLDQTLFSLISNYMAENGATPEQRVQVLSMMHQVVNASQDFLTEVNVDLASITTQAEEELKFLIDKGGAEQQTPDQETAPERDYAVIEFQSLPTAWYPLLDLVPEGANRVTLNTEAFPNDFSVTSNDGSTVPLRDIVGESALSDESSPLARTLQSIIELYTVNHGSSNEVTTYPQSIELIVRNTADGGVEYILLGRIPDGRLVVLSPDFNLPAGSVFNYENGAFTYLVPEAGNLADVVNLQQQVSYETEVVRSNGQRSTTQTRVTLAEFLALFPGFDEVTTRFQAAGIENVLFEYGSMEINGVNYIVPFRLAGMGEAFGTSPFVIDAMDTANLREAPTTRAANTQLGAFAVAPTPVAQTLKPEGSSSSVLNYSPDGVLVSVTANAVDYELKRSAEGVLYVENEGYHWLVVVDETSGNTYFMALLPSAGIDLVSRLRADNFQGLPPFNADSVIAPATNSGAGAGAGAEDGSRPDGVGVDLSIFPAGVRENVPSQLTFDRFSGNGLETFRIANAVQESANHFLLFDESGETIGMFRSDLNVLDGSNFNDGTVFIHGDSSSLNIEAGGITYQPEVRVFFSTDMMNYRSIDALQDYFDNHGYRTDVREVGRNPALVTAIQFSQSGDDIFPSQNEANSFSGWRVPQVYEPSSGQEQLSRAIEVMLQAANETSGLKIGDDFWNINSGIDIFIVGGVTDVQLNGMRGATGYPLEQWYRLNSETNRLEMYISNLSRSSLGITLNTSGAMSDVVLDNYGEVTVPGSEYSLVGDIRISLMQVGSDGRPMTVFDLKNP